MRKDGNNKEGQNMLEIAKKELIINPIKLECDSNGRTFVRGRTVHRALEIKTRYNDWILRVLDYGFVEYVDYISITQSRVTAQGNVTEYIDHKLTVGMAKEICMVQKTPIGRACRKYFIQKEEEVNNAKIEKATAIWQEVRVIGKQVRNELTDTIRDYLIPLAIEQGSQNYNRYYKIYSTLADETAGVMNRDFATSIQLNNLRMAENIIKNVIILRSEEKMYYKDIYQTCKERLQQFKEISFLT